MQNVNLNFYKERNLVLNDAYDRLISKIPHFKKKYGYKAFTVTGVEPGVGATTIAVNIAVAMANSGWKTLLIDADVRKSPSSKRLNDVKILGFSDYLTGIEDYSEVISVTNIDNLHFLPCGTPLENPTTLFNSHLFDTFLADVARDYDYLIFDSSALSTTIDSAVLSSKTSGAILVAAFNSTKKHKIELAVNELEHTDANVLGIVLNNVSKKSYKRYVENYDYFINAKRNKKRRDKNQPRNNEKNSLAKTDANKQIFNKK